MRNTRTIKTQSRPAVAVAGVNGIPATRRRTNSSTRHKLIAKTKSQKSNGKVKEEIRFKEYHDLVERSLEDTAKQINHLLDPEVAKEDGARLLKYSLIDFLRFSKNHYFAVEGDYAVTDDGYLSVDWNVAGHTLANLVFRGKDRVNVYVVSDVFDISERTNVKAILKILTKNNVPVR